MPYRLVVTRPNGSQFQSTTEPLPDREAVGMSALRVLADARVAFGKGGLQLGRDVRDAALGETVTHADSRFGFRTEGF
ncbi:hypothetical protein OG402_41315 [Streptomyces anulatus]|uniref:hypothetical protein n=1 Tax=Streptomyces anulatus TaxID=1892 RepID=UPI0022515E4B|nr:hypothetical protein [Streptomyces anulatus]MCX4606870.1 hypothetical protein [Streptomyces anulatus]